MESCGKGRHLRMILAHKEKSCQERAKDLGEDVVRDLLPREALPYGEANGNGRVEMSS